MGGWKGRTVNYCIAVNPGMWTNKEQLGGRGNVVSHTNSLYKL